MSLRCFLKVYAMWKSFYGQYNFYTYIYLSIARKLHGHFFTGFNFFITERTNHIRKIENNIDNNTFKSTLNQPIWIELNTWRRHLYYFLEVDASLQLSAYRRLLIFQCCQSWKDVITLSLRSIINMY